MKDSNSNPQIRKKLPENEFNLYEIFFKYLTYWPWFLASVLICVIGTLAHIRYTTPVYSISSKILIKEQDNRRRNTTPLASINELGNFTIADNVIDELEILKSKTLIEKTISDLGLYISYTQQRKTGYDLPLYKDSPVQVYMAPEEAEQLMGLVQLKMVYDKNQQLNAHISYINKKGETIVLEKHFSELPAVLPTDIGTIRFKANTGFTPIESVEFLATISKPQAIVGRYRGSMTTTNEKGSNITTISIQDAIPARGVDFINQLIKVYNKDANHEKNEAAQKASDFIEERIAIINSELGSTENELATFKQRSGLTNLASDAQLALQENSRYEQQLTENATQLNLVQELQSYLDDPQNINDIIPSNIGLEDANLNNIINQYNTLIGERNRLLRTSSENNPAVIHLNASIESMRINVQTSIGSVLRGLQITQRNLRREANKFMGRISNAPKHEKEFMSIQRQQEIKAALYTLLLQKREENAITLAATASNGRIIEAPASGGPVAPQKSRLLLFSLIIGIGLPAAIIYLMDMLKYKIENYADVEKITQAPIIGEIPLANEAVKHNKTHNIVIQENCNNVMEETFRALRTNLLFLLEKGQKVILVTSSLPKEGKSFVAANLAVSMAFLGKKTLIIGMDIRKPGLNKTFGFSTRSQGITNLLQDPEQVHLSDIIIPSELSPNLHILPGGSVPPNPTELVSRPFFNETINRLKEHYDYIILDTAPIGMVTDTAIIAQSADVCIMVCRADFTPKAAFKNINNWEEKMALPKLATIINAIDMKQRKNSYSYGYGRKYGYGYGYGYGYEEENNKKGEN